MGYGLRPDAEYLKVGSRARVGAEKRWEILCGLDSTQNYPYPVDFAAYIVKDRRHGTCKTLQALSKQFSRKEYVEIREEIEAALSPEAKEVVLISHDTFWHEGFLCSIHDLRGPPLSELLEGGPEQSERWTRKVFRETLEALDALHSSHVIHGNIDANAIVFTYPSLRSADVRSVDSFYGDRVTISDDGYFEKVAFNEYGAGPSDTSFKVNFAVKLQNLRCATTTSATESSDSTTYCPPPEFFFDGKVSSKLDIWHLGILMTNVICGHPMFATMITGPWTEWPIEQLLYSQRYLGPLPAKYGQTAEDSENKDIFQTFLHYRDKDGYADDIAAEAQSDKFSKQSLELAVDLLRHMMDYDPDKRYSAKQALSHAFFN